MQAREEAPQTPAHVLFNTFLNDEVQQKHSKVASHLHTLSLQMQENHERNID